MKIYLDLLKMIKENGSYKEDRTKTGTYSLFAPQLRFDLNEGFPIVTTKKLFFKGVVAELLWFLKGSSNSKDLEKEGVNIWKNWANDSGELGPIYGVSWRNWNYENIDQITSVINNIKNNPNSRRHLVSAWNVAKLQDMALPPCHFAFCFYVCSNKLSCQFFMRSTDAFLGLPFNIASYALLTHMVAQVTNLNVGDLVFTGNDVHIYSNHLNQVEEQLSRKPFPCPKLALNTNITNIDDFEEKDIKLINYKYHPKIIAPIAI